MATAAHPITNAVFEPNATHALAAAFDEICKEMNLPETARHEREVVATRVIDLGREGVLDPKLLCERILSEVRALR